MTLDTESSTRKTFGMRLLTSIFLAMVIGQFLWMGVFRAGEKSHDFEMVYAGTVAWVEGRDPYRFDSCIAVFRERGGDPYQVARSPAFLSLYPPGAYAVLSPLALLSYDTARVGWIGFNLLAVVVCIGLTRRWLNSFGLEGQRAVGWWVPAVLVLCLAATASNLRLGQTTLIVATLVFMGLTFAREQRPVLAGVGLGLAAAIKPQLAGLFVLAVLVGGYWRTVGWAALVGGVFVGVGVWRAHRIDPGWLAALRDNLHHFQHQGPGDISAQNPRAHMMIHLESPLRAMGMPPLPNGVFFFLVLVLGVGLVGFAVWYGRPRLASLVTSSTDRRMDWLMLLWSATSALTLLVTYHRFYDTFLLLIPACWVVAHFCSGEMRPRHWLAGLMLAVFYLPNSTVVVGAVDRWLPQALHDTLFWQAVVLRHQTWLILALFLLFVLCLWSDGDRSSPTGLDKLGGGRPVDTDSLGTECLGSATCSLEGLR